MLIRDCMSSRPISITPDETLATAQAVMRAAKIRRLPVVDGDALIGILSEYDLRDWMDSLNRTTVGTAMTRDPVAVSPLDSLEHAVTLTREREIGALAVVEHGRLVGIITAKDLWIAEPRPLPQWDHPYTTGLLAKLKR